MKLNASERIALLSTLPVEGSYAMLKAYRELKEELGFSKEECEVIDYKYDPDFNRHAWSPSGQAKLGEKEIEINSIIFSEIQKTLKSLDSRNKLTEQHMSLYEKFTEVK